MTLFFENTEKVDENINLFGEENNEESGEKNGGQFGEDGTGIGTTGTDGISGDNGTGRESNSSGNNGTDNGTNGIGFVQLSFGDSELDGESESDGIIDTGLFNGDNDNESPNGQSGTESNAKTNIPSRPSFLGFNKPKVTEEVDEKSKDIKIKRNYNKKRNKGGMEEEQVEILFVSLFDGFALFRGNHWKLKEEEKHIIPSLTRILNRMLEALPKGVSENAFNIMDYVIVFGAIGAMIISRLKDDKGAIEIGKQERTTEGIGSIGVSERNENDSRFDISEPIRPSGTDKGNENGVSSIAPIKDLANSITRIS